MKTQSSPQPGSTVPPGKKSAILIAGLCGAGLLSGFAARRISAPNSPVAKAGDVSEAADGSEKISTNSAAASRRSSRDHSKTPAAEMPHHKSADTLESLLALKDVELYTRLAGWLTDASEPDIAAFWTSYGPRKGRSNDITSLVFLNWTRLDPHAAIAGSSSDQQAWWAWRAWACHDPEAALAEARTNSPDHVNHVAWGIGEFNPEWLRAHYNELSQDEKDNALNGMAKWSDRQNPLAAMKFLHETGREVDKDTFKALIRQDPWGALDWIKDHPDRNGAGSIGNNINDPMQMVVDTMAAERPDDLERLAAQTPSGALKLKMETAIFASLLESDPEAALEQAKATKAPVVAVQRFAALGLAAVTSDPEQAFAMAGEMFAANPNAMEMMTMIEHPTEGWSGSGISMPEVQNLFAALMKQDPARTVEMAAAVKSDKGPFFNSPLIKLATQWAETDFVSLTAWVNHQTDPAIRSQGVAVVSRQLQNEGNYAESAEWIMSQPADAQTWGMTEMLVNWRRNDPNAAAAWLDHAELPKDRREAIQQVLDINR